MGAIVAILAAAAFIVMLRVLMVLASRPPEARRVHDRAPPTSPPTTPPNHTP